jgi:hypothetical protein
MTLTREQLLQKKELLERKIELEQQLSQQSTEKPQPPDMGIPFRDIVENKIQARPDRLAQYMQASRDPSLANVIMPQGLGLQGIGGLNQRVEAAVANPLLELQQGTPEKAFQSFLQGVKGERMGELGDVIRRTGAGEVPSAVIGSLSLAGVYKGIEKLGQFVAQKAPKLMTQKHRVTQATNIKEGIDMAREGFQAEYDKVYAPFNNKVVGKEVVEKVISKIPKRIQKFALEELGLENLDNLTVKDVAKLRTMVSKEIGQGNWVKAAQGKGVPLTKDNLMDITGELKKVLLDNVDDTARKAILELDPQYQAIMQKGGVLQGKVWDYKANTPKTSWIEGAYQQKDAGNLQLVKDVSKYSKTVKDAAHNVARFASRQTKKRIAGNILKGSVIPLAGWGIYRKVRGSGQ